MMPGDEFRTQSARMCGSYPQCVGCPLYVTVRTKQRRAIRNVIIFTACLIVCWILPEMTLWLWGAFALWNLADVIQDWNGTMGGFAKW